MVCVWTHIVPHYLLNAILLGMGFLVLVFKEQKPSISLVLHYHLSIANFISGLYVLAPALLHSHSSYPIRALNVFLLIIHIFLHDYSSSTITPSHHHLGA